ncbi:unnamed protein product, partial [Nesidiocoris tenuis]
TFASQTPTVLVSRPSSSPRSRVPCTKNNGLLVALHAKPPDSTPNLGCSFLNINALFVTFPPDALPYEPSGSYLPQECSR